MDIEYNNRIYHTRKEMYVFSVYYLHEGKRANGTQYPFILFSTLVPK